MCVCGCYVWVKVLANHDLLFEGKGQHTLYMSPLSLWTSPFSAVGFSPPMSQPPLLGSFAPPTSSPTPQATPTIPLLNPPPGPLPTGLTTLPPPLTSQATPPQPRPQATPPQQRAPPPQQPPSDPFADLGLLSSPPVDPLAVLDSAFVPMESIQPGEGVRVCFVCMSW